MIYCVPFPTHAGDRKIDTGDTVLKQRDSGLCGGSGGEEGVGSKAEGGTSLMVQRLRLRTPKAGGLSSIPG